MTPATFTVFRCVPKRDGTYLITTREGSSAWCLHTLPEGTRITIDAAREARPAALRRAAQC